MMAANPVAMSVASREAERVEFGDRVALNSSRILTNRLSAADQGSKIETDRARCDASVAPVTTVAVWQVVIVRGSYANMPRAGLMQAGGEPAVWVWCATPIGQVKGSQTVFVGGLVSTGPSFAMGRFLKHGTGPKPTFYVTNAVAVKCADCHLNSCHPLNLKSLLHKKSSMSGPAGQVRGIPSRRSSSRIQTILLGFAGFDGAIVDVFDPVARLARRGLDHRGRIASRQTVMSRSASRASRRDGHDTFQNRKKWPSIDADHYSYASDLALRQQSRYRPPDG